VTFPFKGRIQRHRCLAECKGESLYPGIEEFNLEGAVFNLPLLADELIEPVFRHASEPMFVAIAAMIRSGLSSINANAEANRTSARPHHKMQIPRMEAEEDAAIRRFEHRRFAVIDPCAVEAPLIQISCAGA